MTNELLCSADSCDCRAFKEIDIKAHSYFTEKNYLMTVYVCTHHYALENGAKTIINERSLK